MLNDLRYAIRSLLGTPGFTVVALLTLALGIGLNTAVFSVLNVAVLRSLPVDKPHELRMVNWIGGMHGLDVTRVFLDPGQATTPEQVASKQNWGAFSYDTYERFRAQGDDGVIFFGFQPVKVEVTTSAGAFPSHGLFVSGNFFTTYGAGPTLGRFLAAEGDKQRAPAVAVISYRLWQQEFGLNPDAVGRTVTVNGLPCTVVGILPRGFTDPLFGNKADVFLPFSLRASGHFGAIADPRRWEVQVMARLVPGTDERRLTASLNGIFTHALQAAGQQKAVGQLKIALEDGSQGPLSASEIFDQIAKPAWVLMAAVGLLLLIACANLAGLLMARASTRVRELAIRTAVGASRWRLVRLMALENLLLALSGGVLGLLFAMWMLSATSQGLFSRWLTDGAELEVVLDVRVLLFTFGVSLLTAVLSGLLPVWRGARMDPLQGLKVGNPGGGSRLKLGGTLVAVQMGLSMVLLTGTGLLARTFSNLDTFDPGFSADNLLLFDLKPGRAGYHGTREAQFYEAVRSALAATPGVSGVAVSSQRLLTGQGNFQLIVVPGRPTAVDPAYLAQLPMHPERYPTMSSLTVDDAYFSTMEIPLLRGRSFGTADVAGGAPVAVVNQAFVRRYLKFVAPIGATFSFYGDSSGSSIHRIIGVAADAKFADLRNETLPMAYFSHRQSPMRGATFAVRSSLPPASLAPAVRRIVAGVDPRVPVADLTNQKALIDRLNSQERTLAAFGSFVAMLAVLLAGIGLFGLLVYTVSRRTREIGVRMALGATEGSIGRLVLKQGIGLAVIGLVLGLLVSLSSTRLLKSFLWGVEANDVLTTVVVAALLCLVAFMACLIPARRAARIDPLVALRSE